MKEDLTFKEYSEKARSTAMFPPDKGLEYLSLGLVGESGEVANKVKKVIRDTGGEVTDEFKEFMKDEIGDVLWYADNLADFLGLSLEEIAEHNNKKLKSRYERGKIQGSGDNR